MPARKYRIRPPLLTRAGRLEAILTAIETIRARHLDDLVVDPQKKNRRDQLSEEQALVLVPGQLHRERQADRSDRAGQEPIPRHLRRVLLDGLAHAAIGA